MQQISLPFRIALGAMLALGVIWFAVLRPKDAATPTPAPVAPGVAGLTKSAGAAKSAVDKANASSSAREQAADAVDPTTAAAPATTSGATVTPATPAKPAKPAVHAKPKPGSLESYVAGAGPAKSLVAALAHGKVVVFVFQNNSSDSAAVVRAARAVAAASHRGIRLRVTSIGNVGKYAVFTQKTPVAQAPTTLIIGPKRNARLIVGFTTTGEITDAVGAVRRKSASLK